MKIVDFLIIAKQHSGKTLIYESNEIYYEDFSKFDFKDGFNAGDVMIVKVHIKL